MYPGCRAGPPAVGCTESPVQPGAMPGVLQRQGCSSAACCWSSGGASPGMPSSSAACTSASSEPPRKSKAWEAGPWDSVCSRKGAHCASRPLVTADSTSPSWAPAGHRGPQLAGAQSVWQVPLRSARLEAQTSKLGLGHTTGRVGRPAKHRWAWRQMMAGLLQLQVKVPWGMPSCRSPDVGPASGALLFCPATAC